MLVIELIVWILNNNKIGKHNIKKLLEKITFKSFQILQTSHGVMRINTTIKSKLIF
jgi:hypothetical protein